MTEPAQIVAGDSVTWVVSDSERPGPIWAMSYAFTNREGDHFLVPSVAVLDEHTVTLTPADTEEYDAGEYTWQRYFTDGTDRVTTASGSLKVLPNLASGAVDLRTSAKQIIDSIDKVLKGKATQDQLSYSLNGRSLSRMSWAELIAARSHFKREYDREIEAERLASGLGSSRKLLVRFQ